MKFGTLQGVLGEPLPEVFTVAKELGFDGVELDWRDFSEAGEGGLLEANRRPDLREAAALAGVEISSVAAHFLNNGGLASPEPKHQQFGVQAVRTGIELCRDLGAKVLLVPFFGNGEIEGEAGKERLIQNLQHLASKAEADDVMLAIEHTLRGDEATALLHEVGSAYIGDYWDMANCMSLGYDPLTEIKSLKGHIAQVHAKEYDGSEVPAGARPPRSYPGLNTKSFGEGQVPVRDVLAALRQVGYDGYVVLETGAFGHHHKSARAALEHLNASL
ncbi:MAG: sugar phosphate isomerase/epimerase [Abitibacteriaceae bacterium]|nr:sugar phosphate isomerase/epimerase [Abditibacteriaceae bacterium]